MEKQEQVILGDGTAISGACASDGDGKIWIMVLDLADPHNSVIGLIQALATEEARARVEYRFGDREPDVFEGYTEIDTVRCDSDGYCSARLRRPEMY